MTKVNLVKLLSIAFYFIMLVACQNGQEHVTDSGFKYRLYTQSKGMKPVLGDYVTIELVYRSHSDSILFDSRINKTPMRFKLEKIPFKGSYEEGLLYLSEGDSATFYVPADSLYMYYYGKTERSISQNSTIFAPGSNFLFNVKLLKVQNYVDAEQEQLLDLSLAEKTEEKIVLAFVAGKGYQNSKDSGDYFYKVTKAGSGRPINVGKFVSVNYTGKYLDGKVFDFSGNQENPFTFRVGSNKVIKGWEMLITQLRLGDRVELVIPSKNAYAEKGLLDVNTGELIIPPFTPLFYDLEVKHVSDTLKFIKKEHGL